MYQTPYGFSSQEVGQVYRYLGFEETGSKHKMYVHPDYLELRATVTRASGSLPPAYVKHLVKLAERLKGLKEGTT